MHKNSRLKRRRYNYVVSIGEACFCATSLASNGLRQSSGPFDWCIQGSFKSRIDIILSGFNNFLNKEDLVLIGRRDNPEPCDIYQNKKNNIIFNHDFPLGQSLEESYDAVFEKYKRRIQRFFKSLYKSKRALLVYMELPTTLDGVKSIKEIFEASDKLNAHFPNTTVDILYLRHDAQLEDTQVKYEVLENNVILGNLFIAKRNTNDPNSVNKENISKALSFVDCDRKYTTLLKRKFFKSSNRGASDFFVILGIKIRLRGKIKK